MTDTKKQAVQRFRTTTKTAKIIRDGINQVA